MEFCYQAKSMKGEIVRGIKKAACEREVVLWLKELSLAPLYIHPKNQTRLRLGSLFDYYRSSVFFPGVSFAEKTAFFRGLSFLISSGVDLPRALSILLEQASCGRMKLIISHVIGSVNSGVSFSAAMSDFSEIFDPLCVAFARSGEISGRLPENMAALAALLEAKERLRKKIISAMIYPAVVMLVALAVIIVMFAVVLPKFAGAFAALNVAMPPVTMFIFNVGRGLRRFWFFPVLFAGVPFLILYAGRRAWAKQRLDSLALKLPVTGKMLQNAVLSRSFSTMACLLDTGIALPAALEMAGEVAVNTEVRRAFIQIKEGVLAGITLNAMMARNAVFAPAAVQIIRIGEETGKTGAMFKKLAEQKEAELEEGVKRLTSVLEPVMVVFVGALVSFVVLAIFMPVVTAIEKFM